MDGALPTVEFDLLEVSSRRYAHDDADRLSVACLAVRYGRRVVVRDVSLRVRAGELVVLLGHNGCGKSSTLRAVVGLAERAGGEVVLDGRPLAGTPSASRHAGVAFVPSSGETFADLTVRENLVLAAGRAVTHRQLTARLRDATALLDGPRSLLHRRAGTLSGGERRVVGIGLALMSEPSLLLLDEPTKHLAPATAARVLALVRRLADERGIAVLVAEVNVAAALRVADRVYVMRTGEVRAEHTGAQLLAAGPRLWWTLF